LLAIMISEAIWGCGGSNQSANENIDPMQDIGVGPIKSPIVLSQDIDTQMARKGEEIFKLKCTACHKIESKLIGPALNGITKRRNPAWIMNMILDPQGMIEKNPIAKKLVQEYNGAVMTNQGLSQEEARSILEFFRLNDTKGI